MIVGPEVGPNEPMEPEIPDFVPDEEIMVGPLLPLLTQSLNCIRKCILWCISKRHLTIKLLVVALVIILTQWKKNTELTLELVSLRRELVSLQREHMEQSELLNEHQNLTKIYHDHLAFIRIIGEQIEHMDKCYSHLESYSKRIGAAWRSEADSDMMVRLSKYLGCVKELSPSYYLRVKNSFHERIKSCYNFKNVQIDLTIKGDYEKMKAEQQSAKHLPAKTCQLIFNLEELQSNADNNPVGCL